MKEEQFFRYVHQLMTEGKINMLSAGPRYNSNCLAVTVHFKGSRFESDYLGGYNSAYEWLKNLVDKPIPPKL
jgi:hypothetical protein